MKLDQRCPAELMVAVQDGTLLSSLYLRCTKYIGHGGFHQVTTSKGPYIFEDDYRA